MKLYGGIDLHSYNRVVALLDDQDQVVYHKRLGNDALGIPAALAPYCQRRSEIGARQTV